jgi:HEAT repeat protein
LVTENVGIAAAERRRVVAVAGHRGDGETVRRYLDDPAPAVRAAALQALARAAQLSGDLVVRGLSDVEPLVRRRAAELAIDHPEVDLVAALGDPDPSVVEAAAWTVGERGAADDRTVAALADRARHHPDALCREAAVGALGALGQPAGLDAILAATADKPAVRRRAVLALAPFDGPEVDAALQRSRHDRDWQVRQAAEDLTS